jgi:hypothetical protein
MATAAHELGARLGGTARARTRLGRGEAVELHLDTGEVVDATVTALLPRAADKERISVRSKLWSRWAGTTDDLSALVEKATTEIAKRSSDAPALAIVVLLGDNDEERYFDLATFQREMRSTEAGAPGARLREIQAMEITVGPAAPDGLKVTAGFSRTLTASGVKLSVEGRDRAIVTGLTDELARSISAGRPRVPALAGPAQMFVGGIAGALYFIGLGSIDWGFLPDGWVGDSLFLLLYLSGFIAMLYALTAGMRLALPAFTLRRPGESKPSHQWMRRLMTVAGALALAAFPFVLQQVFG